MFKCCSCTWTTVNLTLAEQMNDLCRFRTFLNHFMNSLSIESTFKTIIIIAINSLFFGSVFFNSFAPLEADEIIIWSKVLMSTFFDCITVSSNIIFLFRRWISYQRWVNRADLFSLNYSWDNKKWNVEQKYHATNHRWLNYWPTNM